MKEDIEVVGSETPRLRNLNIVSANCSIKDVFLRKLSSVEPVTESFN